MIISYCHWFPSNPKLLFIGGSIWTTRRVHTGCHRPPAVPFFWATVSCAGLKPDLPCVINAGSQAKRRRRCKSAGTCPQGTKQACDTDTVYIQQCVRICFWCHWNSFTNLFQAHTRIKLQFVICYNEPANISFQALNLQQLINVNAPNKFLKG